MHSKVHINTSKTLDKSMKQKQKECVYGRLEREERCFRLKIDNDNYAVVTFHPTVYKETREKESGRKRLSNEEV